MSLLYLLDFPYQLKNWLRVQRVARKLYEKNCRLLKNNNQVKYENSVDFSGITTKSRSSQHVSMRDVNCKVPTVF